MDPRRLASIIAILWLTPTIASGEDCRPSSCGDLRNISYPFSLTTDPPTCGDSQHQLSCEQNRAVLDLYSTKCYVEEIFYEDQLARVVVADPDYSSCSPRSLPFLPPGKLMDNGPYYLENYTSVTFVTCPASSVDDPSLYIPIASCVDNSSSSKEYLYALAGEPTVADLRKSCAIAGTVPVAGTLRNHTQAAVHDVLLGGFYISWTSFTGPHDYTYFFWPTGFFRWRWRQDWGVPDIPCKSTRHPVRCEFPSSFDVIAER